MPLQQRTLKQASPTSPNCSPVSATTMNDPTTTGAPWAMPKNPGTGHSVYLPTGDRRFPPPCTAEITPHCTNSMPAPMPATCDGGDNDTCDQQNDEIFSMTLSALEISALRVKLTPRQPTVPRATPQRPLI